MRKIGTGPLRPTRRLRLDKVRWNRNQHLLGSWAGLFLFLAKPIAFLNPQMQTPTPLY
jgi:hypothetical protein